MNDSCCVKAALIKLGGAFPVYFVFGYHCAEEWCLSIGCERCIALSGLMPVRKHQFLLTGICLFCFNLCELHVVKAVWLLCEQKEKK